MRWQQTLHVCKANAAILTQNWRGRHVPDFPERTAKKKKVLKDLLWYDKKWWWVLHFGMTSGEAGFQVMDWTWVEGLPCGAWRGCTQGPEQDKRLPERRARGVLGLLQPRRGCPAVLTRSTRTRYTNHVCQISGARGRFQAFPMK